MAETEKFDAEYSKFLVDVLGKVIITFGGLGILYMGFTAFTGWM